MPLRKKPSSTKFTPVSTTIFAVILATFLCFNLAVNIVKQRQQQLEIETLKVQNIIEDEFKTFIFGMQGAKGVIVADQMQFNPKKFRAYAESRDLFNNFPGSLGFGFARYVKRENVEKYLQEQKRIRPNFKIHPKNSISSHMIVEHIEPIENNVEAIGYDFSKENIRSEAALLAAKSGESIISNKMFLFERENSRPGFVFFLPVYKTAKTPASETERMSSLLGWVYAPIVLDDLMIRLKLKIPFGLNVSIQTDENTQINFSNLQIKRGDLLTSSLSADLPLGGRTWKVHVSESSYTLAYSLAKLFAIYILGVLVILAGGYFLYLNLRGKDRSLVEKTNWLNSVIDSAAHSVFATRPDGVIIMFNPASEKMLGYKAEELVGKKTPLIFYDPSEVVQRSEVLSKELNKKIDPGRDTFVAKVLTHGFDTNEWTFYRKNQETIPVRLCISAIYNAQNKLIGYLGIAEDLTEQKKLLSTIEMQRAKMLASAKMSLLGEMAGRIAHEINTPLAIINSHASLLIEKMNADKDSKSDTITRLGKIDITVKRIAKIVKGLRSFSRNSENDSKVVVSVSSIIESTLDLCGEKMLKDEITLKVNVGDNVSVFARATELSQVLMNLLNNAIDAIAHLPEKWIEINSYQENDRIIITVVDCGRGIPSSVAEKMMIPFFTTKEVEKGTGLGLSISKGIVESHDGTFEYDALSYHTRFVISLPAIQLEKNELNECTL